MKIARARYRTVKATLLERVPPGVTTWTVPLVAPAGTVAVISDFETTVNVKFLPGDR
jgi:hypothetical protein